MKYFAKIANLNMPKNKAHQALQDYAISIDNTLLISDHAKDQFITKINIKISEINQEYTRCQDISLSGWNHFTISKEDISIGVHGNFYMIIYPVKNDTTIN